jgi:hypothetical protein
MSETRDVAANAGAMMVGGAVPIALIQSAQTARMVRRELPVGSIRPPTLTAGG